jgi:hypothetical protein
VFASFTFVVSSFGDMYDDIGGLVSQPHFEGV